MARREDWHPMTNRPKPFVYITCLGADDVEYAGLCYSTHRKAIIEPISNEEAEPVIGPIKGWVYGYPQARSSEGE